MLSKPRLLLSPLVPFTLLPLPLQAGSIALQSLSQIRTVAAYNQQERAVKEYDGTLDESVSVSNTADRSAREPVGLQAC